MNTVSIFFRGLGLGLALLALHQYPSAAGVLLAAATLWAGYAVGKALDLAEGV